MTRRAGLLAVLVCSAGCSTFSGRTMAQQDGARMPDLVAVLPPENASNNLAAPDTMRRVAATVLVRHGYLPVVSPSQEEPVRKAGLSDGGQLRALKPAEIAKALGVDGLLAGSVLSFDDLNIGVYRSRVVDAEWTLLDASGAELWKAGGKAADRKVAGPSGQSVSESFVEGLATKLVQKVLRIHLLNEASHCAVLIGHAAPDWPETDPGKLARLRRRAGR